MSDEDYFGDPVGGSLSQSGAKILLREGGPAKYMYDMSVEEETSDEYDFGKAMHYRLLGAGTGYVVLDYASRATNAYKAEAAAARASGLVPLLPKPAARIEAMYEVVMRHPRARALLTCEGQAELAGFIQDAGTGIWLRGKFDRLIEAGVVDYKTTADASPSAFTRSVLKYGYHIQDAMYRRLARELIGPECDRMFFIPQDKEPPYLTAVVELDDDFRAIGDYELDRAIRLFSDCHASGSWAGYGDDLITLSPPRWALRDAEQVFADAEIAELTELLERNAS